MKFINKFFSWTLIYKTIKFIQSIYFYLKDYFYISDTLYSDEFKLVIKRYLNIDLNKDWIGRLYGIINPNIDINGKYNFNNTIIEIDGENTNNADYVKHWIYKQMDLIDKLFKIRKLYDYISIDFIYVGPKNYDNYLIIFDILSRKYLVKCFKKFIIQLIIYTILISSILICI